MGFPQKSSSSNSNGGTIASISDAAAAEIDCKFYLRTGLCKFGSLCKYRHPPIVVQLNVAGLPIRLGEKECVFYLRTGLCKFGPACKFHHPQPYDLVMATASSAMSTRGHVHEQTPGSVHLNPNLHGGSSRSFVYPNLHGLAPSSPQQYLLHRHQYQYHNHPQPNAFTLSPPPPPPPPYLPSDGELHSTVYGASHQEVRLQPLAHHRLPQLINRHSHHHHHHLHHQREAQSQRHQHQHQQQQQQALACVIEEPSMIACAAPSSVVAPPNPTAMTSSASSSASAYASSSSCTGLAMALPQRPGEPDCSFYIKTGICKFGMNCRYHHPKNPSMSPLSSKLSPMGLPLRPGVPVCAFYARNGICKFGPLCKFDHPFHAIPSSSSSSSARTPDPGNGPANHLN